MDNQPHIRFAETPPGSPKSCMKGSRKLTFEEPSEPSPSSSSSETPAPPRSPRKGKGVKVNIRSPEEPSSPPAAPAAPEVKVPPPFQKPPDIHLSQHYDQSTPPPNCTSNGSYDFVEPYEDPADFSELANPRDDPYLMEVANKFVNEIIEAATLEATNREKPDPIKSVSAIARDIITTGRERSSVLVQRAKGTVSKWFTNLCVKAQNSIRT